MCVCSGRSHFSGSRPLSNYKSYRLYNNANGRFQRSVRTYRLKDWRTIRKHRKRLCPCAIRNFFRGYLQQQHVSTTIPQRCILISSDRDSNHYQVQMDLDVNNNRGTWWDNLFPAFLLRFFEGNSRGKCASAYITERISLEDACRQRRRKVGNFCMGCSGRHGESW